jgi:(4-O-methyl)-D-glucuronate---lignin esterase
LSRATLGLVLPALILTSLATRAIPQSSLAQVELTAEQDHRRVLDLLKIESLRPGVNARDPDAPNAANWDESKADIYPDLPDPLTSDNGGKITRREQWWNERRAEIFEHFNREVYGRNPANLPDVKWEVTSTARESKAGRPVITKQLVGRVDNSSYPQISVEIEMVLTTPADTSAAVPVMIHFGGPLPPRRPPRIGDNSPNWQEQVIARGWGYALLTPSSIQADNGAGLTRGIIGLMNKGRPRVLEDWGALRAWAWGASRALDYLETDKDVDAQRVGIEGVSRYGKATVVAMAYEPRFSIAFVGSSGAGGVKLHRRNYGEIVENVAAVREYHWMANNYLKYAGPLEWDDLPVDSHQLVALCAPRPVFVSSGVSSPPPGDGWVDAKGMFLAAVGAGPVYKLLGKKDMGTDEFPAIGTPLTDGDVAFHQHAGGHTSLPSWPTFLKFAERYWGEP